MKIRGSAAALAALLAGCVTPLPMPHNVTLVKDPGSSAEFIANVDFSYLPDSPPDFSKLKLCVVTNVANAPVTLSDMKGAFVGQASGHYYPGGHSSTTAAGQLIKYTDDALRVMIIDGTADTGSAIVRYQLTAKVEPMKVSLVFDHIARAVKNSGAVSNFGFMPVGNWAGAQPLEVHAALSGIADRVKRCMR